jgi:hypothetical protein
MAYSIDQMIAEKVKKELVSLKIEVVKLLNDRIDLCEKEITYEEECINNGTYRDRSG